ncbi:hypothetical protein ACIBIZ_38240 [Nonomuraea spiralis]|uniref:hypothetical protein n=1 Tax=Nonomuraea spiralis TaxID=46182 RepID=UPI0037882961
MIKRMPIRRLPAGLGGVAVLFTAAPAVASTSTSATLTYACRYDGSNVRSSPRIISTNLVAQCNEGFRLFPTGCVRGDYSGGDNRWYTWASNRYIHISQVTVSGSGGGIPC